MDREKEELGRKENPGSLSSSASEKANSLHEVPFHFTSPAMVAGQHHAGTQAGLALAGLEGLAHANTPKYPHKI